MRRLHAASVAPAVPLLLGAVLAFGIPRISTAQTLLVEAELLHTQGPEGTIRNGAVLVRGGRIAAVGPRDALELPNDALQLQAPVVTPGLIDAHSVAGLAGIYNVPADQDADERSGPNQAGLRAIDGFNLSEPLLGWLLAHGVTVVQSGPGEANPIGGLAGVFKTTGRNVEEATLRFPSALVVTLGEPPKATYGPRNQFPSTRMGTAALVRTAFLEARNYGKTRKRAERGGRIPFFSRGDKRDEPPERDLAKEALLLALERKVPVLVTARREDDILTAIRIAEEFDLDLELADAVEAYLVADRIARARAPVFVGPVMERPDALETMNLTFENAAILAHHGISLAFQSGFESYVPRIHVVLFEAALAAAYGLGFERALAALTIEAARLLGVDERVGSLEPGKDADLVLFDGDPFEYTTRVEAVLVNGKIVYQREEGSGRIPSATRNVQPVGGEPR